MNETWQLYLIQGIIFIFSVTMLLLITRTISRLKSGSLGRQLLYAFFGIVAISFLPLFLIFTWQLRGLLVAQTGESFALLAEANSYRLGEELAREIDLLRSLSENETLLTRITATSEAELGSLSAVERVTLLRERDRAWQEQRAPGLFSITVENPASQTLRDFVQNFPIFRQIFLTDRYGGLVAAVGTPPPRFYFAEEQWWQDTWNSRFLSDLYINSIPLTSSQPNTAIQVAVPVRNPLSTTTSGILQSQINLEELAAIAQAQLPGEAGQFLIVVDGEGTILYNADQTKIGTKFPPSIWNQIQNSTTAWAVYQNDAGADYIFSRTPLLVPSGHAPLQILKWQIIVQQERVAALQPINRLTALAIIGGLLALLGAFFLSHYMTRRITKPIEELTGVAAAMAKGDLNQTATLSGPTEFRTLALAFNRMTGELRQLVEDLELEVKERKQVEAKLKAYTEELERSNSELQDFAYAASHDLQEPLRKIQTFGNRLENKYTDFLDDRGRMYLNRMTNAAERMQTLIIDLLLYSRVTTQAQPFTPVDLTTIIQEVLIDLETTIETLNGEVQLESIPALEADPTQMRQLFQNLISNALKFHRDGVSPVVTITGIADPAKNICIITVKDNGIGFEDAYRDRIFSLFQRLHGRSEYEGSGIGLSVCRKIVERHQGGIKAAGRAGEGATFTITLPIRQTPPPS